MIQKAAARFDYVQQQAEIDKTYLLLEQQRTALEPRVRAVVIALPEEQRLDLIEYLGLCEEMGLRLLEIASFAP